MTTPPVNFFELVTVDGVQEYHIANPDQTPRGSIPLFNLVKNLVPGIPLSRRIRAEALYLALGKLRASQLTLREYNASLALSDDDKSLPEKRYAAHHATELFSALGFSFLNANNNNSSSSNNNNSTVDGSVKCPGLDELVASIEERFADKIASYRVSIQNSLVEFDGLAELFPAGSMVSMTAAGLAASSGVRAAYRVRSSWFEEKKTLFRAEKCFKVRLECLVPFGRFLALVSFEETYSGWTGAGVKSLDELGGIVPLNTKSKGEDGKLDTSVELMRQRGLKCLSMLPGSTLSTAPCRFVEYKAGSFFVHAQQKRSYLVPAAVSGRIVIDPERGVLLGHYPSQASDEFTLAMMAAAARYKRILSDPSFSSNAAGRGNGAGATPPQIETMLLFTPVGVPDQLIPLIWPALVGFSFATKAWGHVLVEGLQEIEFNERAFDQLVLDPDRKRLIRALVKFGGKPRTAGSGHGDGRESVIQFQDIVAGKTGGSVFLLHGPPGVGKTLTAEAIAEVLHRPLYYVTMGELGTNPEEMEKRLGSVLDLCSEWDALALIDEADVFLEKRASGSNSDILRNACVCVMLRLLEYHQGILFLTTNRVLEFDPAFSSRVTISLRYDYLSESARAQIWRNLLSNLAGVQLSPDVDVETLSRAVMNGRQIKNCVRLAIALAQDSFESKESDKVTINMSTLQKTVEICLMGEQEISDKNVYSL